MGTQAPRTASSQPLLEMAVITLRTGKERRLERHAQRETWNTFFPGGPDDPFAGGFGSLCGLTEDRLPPGGALSPGPSLDGELLTFVSEGALQVEEPGGGSTVIRSGELQRSVAARDATPAARNGSSTEWAQILRLWLRPPPAGVTGGREGKLFTAADRRGRLLLVASQGGQGGSLPLSQDARLHAALLESGSHVVHALPAERGAWLHVVRGEVTFGGVVLSAGDGAGITGPMAVSVTARQPSSILLLETGGPPKPPLPSPSGASVFGLLWEATMDILGPMATSAVLRRAIRRALPRHPELGGIEIDLVDGRYRYTLSPYFEQAGPAPTAAIRALLDQLRPLLEESAGQAAFRRLERVPQLREWAEAPRSAAEPGPEPAADRPSRLSTGNGALDRLLGGGLPVGSLVLVAGPPGTGKTLLALQAAFDVARRGGHAIYFTTLAEPSMSLLRSAQGLPFFDASNIGDRLTFVDLEATVLGRDPDAIFAAIAGRVEREEPALVVIDGLRAIRDLVGYNVRVRKLAHDLAVHLSAWGATALMLGQYTEAETAALPEFAVADGVLWLEARRTEQEPIRSLEVLKLRGCAHAPGRVGVALDGSGLRVL